MRPLLEAMYSLLLCVLVGAQLALGYLVAPTLFSLLDDRALAGTLAGALFERAGWIALVVLLLLFSLRTSLDRSAARTPFAATPAAPRRARVTLLLMLVLTIVGHLILRPWIASMRAEIQRTGGFDHVNPALQDQFGMLHGASSLLFLLVVLLGISLVLRLRDRALLG